MKTIKKRIKEKKISIYVENIRKLVKVALGSAFIYKFIFPAFVEGTTDGFIWIVYMLCNCVIDFNIKQ